MIPPDGAASANFTEYRYGTTEMDGFLYQVKTVFDAKGAGQAFVYDPADRLPTRLEI